MRLVERKQILFKGNIVKEMSFEEVLVQFDNLIHKTCSKYFKSVENFNQTYEDLESLARYSLFMSYRKYDPSTKSIFLNFAATSMTNEFLMLYRYHTLPKRDARLKSSMDETFMDDEGDEITLHDLIPSNQNTEAEVMSRFIINEVDMVASKYKLLGKDVMLGFLRDVTQQKLSEKYGISRGYVARKFIYIRNDLRKELSY